MVDAIGTDTTLPEGRALAIVHAILWVAAKEVGVAIAADAVVVAAVVVVGAQIAAAARLASSGVTAHSARATRSAGS